MRLFGAKAFTLLILASHIAEVGTTFNVFSYDAVRAEHRTHHLPIAEQIRYVLCHGRGNIIDVNTRANVGKLSKI